MGKTKNDELNAVDALGGSALSRAARANDLAAVRDLVERGIDMKLHGGLALRAAMNGSLDLVKYLVEHGADLDYDKRDQVVPYRATPLQALANQYKPKPTQLEVARYLLEAGADPTITDAHGNRAYHLALSNHRAELVALIRSYEPDSLHDAASKVAELKKLKVPKAVIDFLERENRRVKVEGSSQNIAFIDFCAITEVTTLVADDELLVSLASDVDGWSPDPGFLSWMPSKKAFVHYDVEHQSLQSMPDFTWTKFLKRPAYYLDRIVEGRYEQSA